MLPDASILVDPTADRSYLIRDVNITLMVLSTIFVVARVYVRKFMSNSFGLDDCSAVVSLVRIQPKERRKKLQDEWLWLISPLFKGTLASCRISRYLRY